MRAEQGAAAYGGTVKSEIIGMVPTPLAQLFGREGNDQAEATPTYESSALTDLGGSCSVTSEIKADPVEIPVLDPPVPEPRRKVPMPTSGPATSLVGFGPGRGAPPGEAKGTVVVKGLETNESLQIKCPGIEQSIDTPGQVAGLFNGLHMDELDQGFGGFVIDLEEGSGNVIGKKVYDRTGTLDGVPVTELTTIQLVHTPTTSG